MKNIEQSDTQPLHKKATENSNIDIDGLIYQNREKSSEQFAQTYSYNSINQKFGNSKIRYLPIVLAYLLEFEFASLKSYEKGTKPQLDFQILVMSTRILVGK